MKEESFGIIPVEKRCGSWHVLVIQHRAGHWGFPKGKREVGETDRQTAERELFEETHLKVSHYLSDTCFSESYVFTHKREKIEKTVFYFLCEVYGDIGIQEKELIQARWFPLSEAFSILTYLQAKEILFKVQKILTSLHT